MGIIDVWIFDIVEIYDVVLVTHLSIIKIVTTHAFWNILTKKKTKLESSKLSKNKI